MATAKPAPSPSAGEAVTTNDASSSPQSPQPESEKKKRKGTHASASANTDIPELEVDLSLPEPPSKRAKRALKKGKTLPVKQRQPDDRDADDDTTDAKDGDKKKSERSQWGIWIGNLPFTVTRPQLFQWFIDNSGGAITEADITRINLPIGKRQPNPQQHRPNNIHADSAAAAPNKGFAYVDFATYEAQIAATALSETELDGRRVLIKDSKSFEGRPAKEKSAGEDGAAAGADGADAAAADSAANTNSTKVFVGNLGFETSEEDLRRQFAPCGPIAWIKVATFPDNTEKCRGYGWVQFGGKTDEGHNVTPEVAATAAAAAVKGFVRIVEKVDTEEDFVAEAEAATEKDKAEEGSNEGKDEGEDSDIKASAKPYPARTTRTRKWWVNMLKGRQLKVQFAEDDVARYKKRFGKGRPREQNQDQDQDQTQSQGPRRPRPDRVDRAKQDGNKGYKHQDLDIAQRTGAITASLGKKTILE